MKTGVAGELGFSNLEIEGVRVRCSTVELSPAGSRTENSRCLQAPEATTWGNSADLTSASDPGLGSVATVANRHQGETRHYEEHQPGVPWCP